jgi:hypothetical protein
MAKLEALDVAAGELTGGIYVQADAALPDYDVRRILDYCKQRGVSPSSLTDEELAGFVRRDRRRSR